MGIPLRSMPTGDDIVMILKKNPFDDTKSIIIEAVVAIVTIIIGILLIKSVLSGTGSKIISLFISKFNNLTITYKTIVWAID